jgi:deoxyadenosine/deoxycytidine kinase
MHRIVSRGRVYEKEISETYVKLLDDLNHAWLIRQKKIPVVTITTDRLNIVTSKRAQKQCLDSIKKSIVALA